MDGPRSNVRPRRGQLRASSLPPVGLIKLLSLDSFAHAWPALELTETGPAIQARTRSILGPGRPTFDACVGPWRQYARDAAGDERRDLARMVALEDLRERHLDITLWTTVLRRWLRKPETLGLMADTLPVKELAETLRQDVRPEEDARIRQLLGETAMSPWDRHLVYDADWGYAEVDLIEADILSMIKTRQMILARRHVARLLREDGTTAFELWVAREGRRYGGTGQRSPAWT